MTEDDVELLTGLLADDTVPLQMWQDEFSRVGEVRRCLQDGGISLGRSGAQQLADLQACGLSLLDQPRLMARINPSEQTIADVNCLRAQEGKAPIPWFGFFDQAGYP